jgi:hypothetical protein
MRGTDKIIHCIGDSHVSFFSGTESVQPKWPEKSEDRLPFFRTYRLGAVLAYSLCEFNTRMRGREKLFSILKEQIPPGNRLLLCFGEIDCRAHLLRQSIQQHKPIEEIVRKCVRRYYSVIKEMMDMNYELIIWSVIPSTLYEKVANEEFPVYGTCQERNHVTRLFNRELEKLSRPDEVMTVSIYDELVDENGLTRMEYYKDSVHLSQRAMPLLLEKLKRSLCDTEFDLPVSNRIRRLLESAGVRFSRNGVDRRWIS